MSLHRHSSRGCPLTHGPVSPRLHRAPSLTRFLRNQHQARMATPFSVTPACITDPRPSAYATRRSQGAEPHAPSPVLTRSSPHSLFHHYPSPCRPRLHAPLHLHPASAHPAPRAYGRPQSLSPASPTHAPAEGPAPVSATIRPSAREDRATIPPLIAGPVPPLLAACSSTRVPREAATHALFPPHRAPRIRSTGRTSTDEDQCGARRARTGRWLPSSSSAQMNAYATHGRSRRASHPHASTPVSSRPAPPPASIPSRLSAGLAVEARRHVDTLAGEERKDHAARKGEGAQDRGEEDEERGADAGASVDVDDETARRSPVVSSDTLGTDRCRAM
ncbi:hypothetical protein B0H16DRAFT_1724986 [Mycena metata]|uniref:Uncharacterized protein n=1 Tax=Mycena metata TaxID=1033252 RepID=A0AAD7ISR1_9AGAR|nr:hypothetical protein B0H16DRAFT_1724986 [Mycena metata]